MSKNIKVSQKAASVLLAFIMVFGSMLTLYAEPARVVPCVLGADNGNEDRQENETAPFEAAPFGGELTLEALFGPMPLEVHERQQRGERVARRYHLGRGITFHMCWSWGVRVEEYNPEEDFNGWQYDRFTLWQDEVTRNLIITDNHEFIAFYDVERGITKTLAYDGTRSYRFRTFSVYFFSDGYVTLAHPEIHTDFRINWVWQWELFNDETLPVSLNYVMELDDRFMQLIGFNFFQIGAWNQETPLPAEEDE